MMVFGQSKLQCYKTVWAKSLNLSFFRFPLEQRCSKIHCLKQKKKKEKAEKDFLLSPLYPSRRTLFFKRTRRVLLSWPNMQRGERMTRLSFSMSLSQRHESRRLQNQPLSLPCVLLPPCRIHWQIPQSLLEIAEYFLDLLLPWYYWAASDSSSFQAVSYFPCIIIGL